MRKLRLINSLALVLIFTVCTVMYACTLDPVSDPPGNATQSAQLGGEPLGDPSGNTSDTSAIETSVTGIVDDAVTPFASCSVVQFCNAPGSDGTRCLQQGCSLATARAECRTESKNVCGNPVCPWIFVATNGQRFLDSSCCSSGVACLDSCCPAGGFCGINGACCDGIHSNGNCPP
jgi:hypothetical protein